MPKLFLWSAQHQSLSDLLAQEDLVQTQIHEGYTLPDYQPGDTVLAMGSEALTVLQAKSLLPKNRKIGSLRGTPYPLEGGGILLPTYTTRVKSQDWGRWVDVQIDYQLARRLTLTGSPDPVFGNYRYVDDFSEFLTGAEAIYASTQQPVRIAIDLETETLDPFNPETWIITIQASHTAGMADVVYFEQGQSPGPNLLEQIRTLLTSPKFYTRGANFKYDLLWMAVKWGLTCTNFTMDTGIVGSLLDENRNNSLKTHTKIYVPTLGGYDDGIKEHDKGAMSKVPKSVLLPYAGGDSDATLQVAEKQTKELIAQPRLANFYVTILHPAARAYELVEQCGVLVNREKFEALKTTLEQELVTLEQKVFASVPRRVKLKHHGKLSLSRPSLVRDIMFSPAGFGLKPDPDFLTAKTKEPSTAMDHLKKFRHDPRAKDFISTLAEYNSADKTLSTYVVGFLKHLRADSRFHPSYFLYNTGGTEKTGGTSTGRLSARDPAWQTVPAHTKWADPIRDCIEAPEGFVIIGADYSQGELKIAACLAQEPTMIQAYRDGIDLHALSSSRAMGMEWEEMVALKTTNKALYDQIRQSGKAINFGLIYGMGAESFQEYAETQYGVIMSLEKAQQIRDVFFATYPALLTWHRRYKAIARENLAIESPLGRIRHLPLIRSLDRAIASKEERRAVNSPVQCCLSDMSLWATALLHQQYGMKPDGFCCNGMIHDALYFYAPEDNAELWRDRIVDTMEDLPFEQVGWKPELKFTVEAKIGKTLATLH